MNKQQLIDKAIDDLRLAAEDQFFGKRFLCRTQLTDGRFAYYGTDYPYLADDLVCAKHEFQARKAEREAMTNNIGLINQARKELGIENTPIIARWQLNALEAKISEIKSRKSVDELIVTTNHWYDYENKKALRFPPVGEVVQMVTNLDEVRIVAHDSGFAVYWYGLFAEYQHTDAYELFRPLDWDKNKNDELQELTLLINSGFITTDPEGIAKAILAAGYRKCDNKTSSTQEQIMSGTSDKGTDKKPENAKSRKPKRK